MISERTNFLGSIIYHSLPEMLQWPRIQQSLKKNLTFSRAFLLSRTTIDLMVDTFSTFRIACRPSPKTYRSHGSYITVTCDKTTTSFWSDVTMEISDQCPNFLRGIKYHSFPQILQCPGTQQSLKKNLTLSRTFQHSRTTVDLIVYKFSAFRWVHRFYLPEIR